MNWTQLLSPERQGQKSAMSTSSRSAFEQDYDRIIFSHPFRRLQDKTQVHPLPEHDFVHTRLTHSLEVSVVGRSLGRRVGEVILQRNRGLADSFSMFDFGAVVAAASLAHDLGNPPFGHAGEDALTEYFSETTEGQAFKSLVTPAQWADLTSFEGNAQGFRIINSNAYGLNLTNATLAAFTKYPCGSLLKERDKSRKSQKKYGYFQTETSAFRETAEHVGLEEVAEGAWCRHPLAFLVEAADDICYNVIDLEDACRLGLVSYNDTVTLLAGILGGSFNSEKLNKIKSRNERIGVLRALAINKLVEQCTEVFVDQEQAILNGGFDKALSDLCASRAVMKDIAEVSVRQIYRARHVIEIEASGHEVLPGLLKEFVATGRYLYESGKENIRVPRKYSNMALLLPEETRVLIAECTTIYEMLRHVLDVVSGLTDKHAVSLFRRLRGIA